MKVPFMDDNTIARVRGNGVKVLFYLCDRGVSHSGLICDAARIVCISPRTWQRCVDQLVELGLIEYSSTTQGYKCRVIFTKRFTHVPDLDHALTWASTGTACKLYLALCRAKPNNGGGYRFGRKKMAQRLGRCLRTVSTHLRQMGGFFHQVCLYRTGRSSLVVFNRTDKQLRAFETKTAHRSGHLLHILSLSTPKSLSESLAKLAIKSKEKAFGFRQVLFGTSPFCERKQIIRRELKHLGVDFDEATSICSAHTVLELERLLLLMRGRLVSKKNPLSWINMALRSGWCIPPYGHT